MRPEGPSEPKPSQNAEPAPSQAALEGVCEVAEPLCAAHGVELVEVYWTSDRSGRVLRVVIDRPQGLDEPLVEGVTLEDCVRVSRDLSTALDVEEIIEHSYNLEVSSPGLDRPLRTERDFRRQRGRLAKIKLCEPAPDGQRVLRGTILEADSDAVRMRVDGNEHQVPFENIAEAKLVFEIGGQQKKGKGPSSGKKSSRGRKSRGKRR